MSSQRFQQAEKMGKIESFHAMDIMQLAAEMSARGEKVMHLEVGEPSFATPKPIVDAGQRALAEGLTHYTRAIGIESLRKAVSAYYWERFSLKIDWERIVITAGASAGLMMSIAALIDEGEEVLLTDPGYPCYPNYVKLLGGKDRYINLDPDNGYKLGVDDLRKAWGERSRVALVASPANPTGAVLSLSEIREIADYVRSKNACLIVDEIYQGLSYEEGAEGNKAPGDEYGNTALQVADDIIVVNSFSKYFGMTGWRIGWSVFPLELVPSIEKLAQNIMISPPTISQYAAVAAFSKDTQKIVEEQRKEFKLRKDYLFQALQELGFEILSEPMGAFYIYANVQKFTDDSFEFCRQLLATKAVAVTPGLDFSPSNHKYFVRFSYTADLADLKEAVARIADFLSQRK